MPNTLMNDKPISTHGTPAVHLSLQGKGGVGKSLIASFLAQYYKDHGVNAVCVDTDPVNHTFAQYTALGAKHLPLMEGNQIDWRRFDSLIDSIVESGVMSVLREADRRLVIHTVITGGQALADTLARFESLAGSCESRSLIVWVNEFFGPVEYEGTKFSQMPVFLEHKDKVAGIVLIPRFSPDTFGRDLEDMIARKLTFGEIAWATDDAEAGRSRSSPAENQGFLGQEYKKHDNRAVFREEASRLRVHGHSGIRGQEVSGPGETKACHS
jgi:hypothetical protein